MSLDIAILILLWLARDRKLEGTDLAERSPAIGADDLKAAYRGMPNLPSQIRFVVIPVRHPGGERGRGGGRTGAAIQFAECSTHLFGMAAAVANFNRLPELLTAVSRRIGACPTWHFFVMTRGRCLSGARSTRRNNTNRRDFGTRRDAFCCGGRNKDQSTMRCSKFFWTMWQLVSQQTLALRATWKQKGYRTVTIAMAATKRRTGEVDGTK